MRAVHDRVVMQLLGELDAAVGLDRTVRGEQQPASIARAIADEGEQRHIAVDRRKRLSEQSAPRGTVAVARLASLTVHVSVGVSPRNFGWLKDTQLVSN